MTLSTLLRLLSFLLALCLCACTGKEEPAAPVVPRVAAVEAKRPLATAEEWCDVYFSETDAPLLKLPDAVPTSRAAAIVEPPADSWIWVNLWATWCGPCLREIPLIERWIAGLEQDGTHVALWFLSLDEDEQELSRFLDSHPKIAGRNSVRLKEPDKLGAWVENLRLRADTGIPINILAAPGSRVRCVRTGAINESDYQVVRSFLKSAGAR